jgi:hypothetical protein
MHKKAASVSTDTELDNDVELEAAGRPLERRGLRLLYSSIEIDRNAKKLQKLDFLPCPWNDSQRQNVLVACTLQEPLTELT